ncbi:hypothetical protein O3P69_004510 [Scylla paramamosain]|uniref:Uncharacterized protein n=1 Tax=Scylla paramamosain TaxID=85552 RepID=A0AAW0UCA8_SCYPA
MWPNDPATATAAVCPLQAVPLSLEWLNAGRCSASKDDACTVVAPQDSPLWLHARLTYKDNLYQSLTSSRQMTR